MYMEPQTTSPEQSKTKTKRILKWALIVAMVIVLNLFFNYTVSLLYKAPVFETFCPVELTSKAYVNKEQCVTAGGMWNETTVYPAPTEDGRPTKAIVAQPQPQVTGYCDATYTCQKTFQEKTSMYDRNVFMVLVGLGVVSIGLGVWLSAISVVSLGLSFGGVLSLIIGSMRYWSDMQDWLRVAVLAAALAVLIWIGIKKIKE